MAVESDCGPSCPQSCGGEEGSAGCRDECAAFFTAIDRYRAQVNTPHCTFNIQNLPEQIQNECVWSNSQQNPGTWGGPETTSISYGESMISRLRTMIHSLELACVFGTAGASLANVLNDFCTSNDDDLIRISFKNVRFDHHTREILLNIIGRYMLDCAQRDVFRDRPMIAFFDGAHQLLGRTGDEYGSVCLDGFGLIAKEGREYDLSRVLAPQRPRDVPADVLSQLGTLIVHRLTNDRDTLKKACGDLDRDAAMFIPTLAPSEAIVIGPDIPAPASLPIGRPSKPPNSKGPAFQRYWSSRRKP